MRKFIFAFFIFMLPFIAVQAGILGDYQVKGFDPISSQPYTGKLTITIEDGIYCATWVLSDGSAIKGVGLLKCCQLSFVYQGSDGLKPGIGLQVYQIKDDKLTGPWIEFEVYKIGQETATKIETKKTRK